MEQFHSLAGKILIAMPGMEDPRFAQSVILICAHGDDGAMGLVVNKALPEMAFTDLLEQLGIDTGFETRDIPLRFGGPVEPGRGFVLHHISQGDDAEGVMRIGEDLAMTTTRDILEDFASGGGPEQAMLALGYAGWGPGQLDREIRENGWLTADRGDEIIFGANNELKWTAALRKLGIDPLVLSPLAGRA